MGPARHLDVAGQKLLWDNLGNFDRGREALCCGRETVLEAFQETIWARVIASQKFSRDSGETIFAARHQDVSQGPLGSDLKSQ